LFASYKNWLVPVEGISQFYFWGWRQMEYNAALVRATTGSAALRPPKTGRLNPAYPAARQQFNLYSALPLQVLCS